MKSIGMKGIGPDDFVLLPPKPGTCPVCAADHTPDLPHNRDSLFYQMRFYQRHGRFPTWADAMAHCSETMKAFWKAELIKRGVKPEDIEIDGAALDQQT